MTGPGADRPGAWTNASVLAFAGDDDPLVKITTVVRAVMARAADEGLGGPPFDPLAIARMLGLRARPRADVPDARVIAEPTTGPAQTPDPAHDVGPVITDPARLVVEYNPTRPRGRLRYSVAHEVAHALFPDVADAPRHRTGTGAVPGGDDSWQLELLCNVAAAEMLMPGEAVQGLLDIDLDIDFLMAQRRRFDVSTEALLRRVAAASTRPVALLALLRRGDHVGDPLTVEYQVQSRTHPLATQRGTVLDAPALRAVTAVGQTVRTRLELDGVPIDMQAVGSPPYLGRALPRVLALVQPVGLAPATPTGLRFRSGDVTDVAAADGPVVIGHVTNDAARGWGPRGAAAAVGRRFPSAKAAYRQWAVHTGELQLGDVHLVETSESAGVHVASLVVQRGYGPDSRDRLSYTALAEALATLARHARRLGAEVRLPRLGTGQGGGRWDLIEAELDEQLVRRGVEVTVYTLPAGGAS